MYENITVETVLQGCYRQLEKLGAPLELATLGFVKLQTELEKSGGGGAPFQRFIASTRCCALAPSGLNGTGSDTSATAPFSLYAGFNTASRRAPGQDHPAVAPAPSSSPFWRRRLPVWNRVGNPHHCRQSLDPENRRRRASLTSTPTSTSLHAHYPSWLNQVEIWFSKIQRDIIVRGVFESISQGKSCDTSATTTKRRSPSDRSSPSIRTTELPKYRRANPISRSLSSATVH